MDDKKAVFRLMAIAPFELGYGGSKNQPRREEWKDLMEKWIESEKIAEGIRKLVAEESGCRRVCPVGR